MQDEVRALAQQWAEAELNGDAEFLARTLAYDFIGVGPLGFMLTKEQWLIRHQSGDLRYAAFSLDEVTVRLYGDTAVLIGRQTQRAKYRGQDVIGQFRTTLLMVQQQDAWVLVGLQLSAIPEER